jgi:hypothetical protein
MLQVGVGGASLLEMTCSLDKRNLERGRVKSSGLLLQKGFVNRVEV